MEHKFDALTLIVKEMGLTPQEVVQHWVKNGELAQEYTIEPQKIDIRTQANLYWYFFANGEFSEDANAYKGCLGVVGWINPNKNAPDGDKVYIVLRKQANKLFSLSDSQFKTSDEYDGYGNTQLILQHSQKSKISFPAASCCNDALQLKNLKRAFLPAKEQAIRLAKNSFGIRNALAKIGGTFDGHIWTSSMFIPNNIWVVHTQCAEVSVRNRTSKANITAIMAL